MSGIDVTRLADADAAYEAGDWRTAAREYLAAVHHAEASGTGHSFHMAGNALLRLQRHADAARVYGHALKDPTYDKRAAVLTNLGTALAALDRPQDAVEAFSSALREPGNEAAWKAQQGRAGALYDLERFEEASHDYREAAWATDNTDPGRTLNNLGTCFMAMGHPEEAVSAYRAAVATEGYGARGKASANLGLALAQMGLLDDAVMAFEAARDAYGHPLAGAAQDAYEAALASGAVSGGAAGGPDALADPAAPTLAVATTSQVPARTGDSAFFTMTEAEMDEEGRAAGKALRHEHRTGSGLVLRIALSVLIACIIAGGMAAAWYVGIGYPTQTATVSGMIAAYRSGQDVSGFWIAVPATDVKRDMRSLPARFESYTIDRVESTATSSTAHVAVQLDAGGMQRFAVTLSREGVGWKVSGVSNEWLSTGG